MVVRVQMHELGLITLTVDAQALRSDEDLPPAGHALLMRGDGRTWRPRAVGVDTQSPRAFRGRLVFRSDEPWAPGCSSTICRG